MAPEKELTRSFVLKSRLAEMRKGCRRVLADVRNAGFSCEEIFAIHLAVEEAMVNAHKHGNRKSAEKTVTVEYSTTPEKFDITVADQGAGFDPSRVPDPRKGANIEKDSGRGVLLMQSYMDIVEYNTSGNCVHMVKFRAK
jgi:serine/threonine-protein kinase RsbW